MYNSLRKLREEEGGFTLIELLIVIVILGILAAIVIFAVTGINNKGSQAACRTDVKTLDTAAEAYYAQFNTGATTLDQLVTAGLLHKDSQISGVTKTVPGANGYTITFTAGSATSAGNADTVAGLSGGGCP